MRLISNIPHELYQISIFEWNNKFILKIESGPYEQSYKIDAMETTEKELPSLLNDEFLKGVTRRFNEMHVDFMKTQGW